MANAAQNQGIKNSWSLIAFAKSHGRMKVVPRAEHVNTQTGEVFEAASCAFIHPTEKDEQGRAAVTFVAFSSKLGELSPAEIAAQKDELQVAQLNSGNYVLCKQGDGWSDVDLGL